MKKMMSLAAMFAVLAYASPASAELKLGGDAGMRARMEFNDSETGGVSANGNENSSAAFRVRLTGAADLGDGYYFKTMISTEQNNAAPVNGVNAVSNLGGGWFDTDDDGAGLELTNFYFGRKMENSSWAIGRMPLGSFNNPIYDLAYFAVPSTTGLITSGTVYAVDTPTDTWMNDRTYAINYTTKLGDGDASASLVFADNDDASGNTGAVSDGFLNDGYALNFIYTVKAGDVTIAPQALICLTDLAGTGLAYNDLSSNTFGANVTIPAGDAKIGLGGFYTICDDEKGTSAAGTAITGGVDYTGYLFRVKGEMGNAMLFVDYNATEDKTAGYVADYSNVFVRAAYKIKVHESATGTFSLTPTLRYLATSKDVAGTASDVDTNQLRAEMYATVTF
jgi:hypothetical protein